MEILFLEAVREKYAKADFNHDKIDVLLAEEITKSPRKIIVLDDDPTGVQTVHDVFVFTDWSVDSIRKGFAGQEKVFFLLTNSRGMTEQQSRDAHREIALNIMQVSKETQIEFMLISRSDSTLRGHYPIETEVLKECLEAGQAPKIDGEILLPYFKEGGRFTLEDIHYVNYEGTLIPAGETEFARDKTFGYSNSNLKQYIEEKTNGRYTADSVTSIHLESLRNMDIDAITQQLLQVEGFNKVIVNALDDRDLQVFCIALYRAMGQGKTFLFRTAASFVRVVGGISSRPLLTRKEMIRESGTPGGLVVIGSHTAKTTEQLDALKEIETLVFVEFNSDRVLEAALDDEVNRVRDISDKFLRGGKTVVIYTCRKLLSLEEDTPEKALVRSAKISDAVQSLVGSLEVCPGFVLAKGGITSSDIGIKALHVTKARVLGQIQPGVPVWETDAESKFPNIPYIIFPGNVGDRNSLFQAVSILLENIRGDEK